MKDETIQSSKPLTRAERQIIQLPLWTITNSPVVADLVILSACESNLSGQDTEGLLTPIGIGPSLAAAGAKTVVGTLWNCNGVAAICFSYYFYKIAADHPTMPWQTRR